LTTGIPLGFELTAALSTHELTHTLGGTQWVRRNPVAVYVAILSVASAVLFVGLVNAGYALRITWGIGVLCVAGALAERGRIRFSSATELSVSLVPVLFAAVALGPLGAAIVGAACMLGDFRRPYLKWATYSLNGAFVGGLAGLAAIHAAALGATSFAAVVLATAVAALVYLALDAALASIVLVLRRSAAPMSTLRAVAPAIAAAVPLYVPLVAFLVFTYDHVSVWTLPLFLVPALAAQRLFALYHEQRELAGELIAANDRLERANLSFAVALIAALDARDRYTAGHSAAVAIYARDIAARMGLSESEQRLVHLCGLVHDIGKIGLPPGLLEKSGALTLDERREMERHSIIGEHILAKVEDYSEIARIVRHHHERIDGEGYPDGLSSNEIPVLSRIICVADAYNAMTSDRPYRDAMPSRVARLRLAQAVESQFDTSVVAAFEAILAGATEEYRLGQRSDFLLEEEELVSGELGVRAVA
jgi:putative nucleotidyltransferase with HDIG domain